VDAGAEAAVGAGDDVLGSEPAGVAGDPLGEQFRVLDDGGPRSIGIDACSR
jgi:hypothetical protein